MGKEVIVIGGGIIGLCTAYYLQKEGHQVKVMDKSNMDAGASHVNAGYLTPSHIVPLAAPGMISQGIKYMFNSASPFYMKPRLDMEFLKWAWAFKKSSTNARVERAMSHIRDINILSRELYDALKASHDLGKFHYERKGLLMLYQTDKEGDHEKETAQKAKRLGLESEVLDQKGIEKIEPNIKVNAIGAVHYLCDGHTTPTDFMPKMIQYLEKMGVGIYKNEEVMDFSISHKKITSIHTNLSEHKIDEVVFAGGSWTSQLVRKLGIQLSIQAGKGYRIDVAKSTGITMPALLLEAKMAVTPMLGFTRFAGTMEFSGINATIRKERVEAIANGAERFYEGLEIPAEDRNNAQCGLRPVSPDGLPYIGKSKKFNNLTIATGHAMMGWSLGPATGLLVSELISGRKPSLDLSPYHPERKFY
ncbi:MAG: FAD-dependent oxidoreductase [Bacteroidota bacterium]